MMKQTTLIFQSTGAEISFMLQERLLKYCDRSRQIIQMKKKLLRVVTCGILLSNSYW